jgi:hypothetical protein
MNSGEPPSRVISRPTFTGEDALGKHWECREYYGCLRKIGRMLVLSISATDESARHDWREFQQLKNMLVGAEWEAVEIYPAESELVDPSNRFYLWCFRKGTLRDKLGAGLAPVRQVIGSDRSIAPQRAFPVEQNVVSTDPPPEFILSL